MLFSGILDRYRKKRERKELVRELIRSLRIDSVQKGLFLESLDVLDDVGMEILYAKLLQFVESVEHDSIRRDANLSASRARSIRDAEMKDRQNESKTFNILLDNV